MKIYFRFLFWETKRHCQVLKVCFFVFLNSFFGLHVARTTTKKEKLRVHSARYEWGRKKEKKLEIAYFSKKFIDCHTGGSCLQKRALAACVGAFIS